MKSSEYTAGNITGDFFMVAVSVEMCYNIINRFVPNYIKKEMSYYVTGYYAEKT